MALARLTKQCRECPFVETCEHKKMEALGYLPEPIMADAKAPVTADIAAPILRETVSRVVDGKWAFSWIKGDLSEMFAWYKDHESYIKLHNNTRSIVEEILEMIRTKLTEVENAEN